MYSDPAHPSDELLLYTCREIAQKIGIMDVNESKFDRSLRGTECFILPEVKRILGLKFKKNEIRNGVDTVLSEEPTIDSWEEYVREYIFLLYDEVM